MVMCRTHDLEVTGPSFPQTTGQDTSEPCFVEYWWKRILGRHRKVNSVPNDKFLLEWSNLKAFADIKSNVAEKLKFVFRRVENIAGKGENADYQHFLFFENAGYQHFLFSLKLIERLLFYGRLKSGLCGKS